MTSLIGSKCLLHDLGVEMGISYYRIFSGSAYLENEKRTMHGLVDSRSESFESEVVNTETETCVYKPFIFFMSSLSSTSTTTDEKI